MLMVPAKPAPPIWTGAVPVTVILATPEPAAAPRFVPRRRRVEPLTTPPSTPRFRVEFWVAVGTILMVEAPEAMVTSPPWVVRAEVAGTVAATLRVRVLVA